MLEEEGCSCVAAPCLCTCSRSAAVAAGEQARKDDMLAAPPAHHLHDAQHTGAETGTIEIAEPELLLRAGCAAHGPRMEIMAGSSPAAAPMQRSCARLR